MALAETWRRSAFCCVAIVVLVLQLCSYPALTHDDDAAELVEGVDRVEKAGILLSNLDIPLPVESTTFLTEGVPSPSPKKKRGHHKKGGHHKGKGGKKVSKGATLAPLPPPTTVRPTAVQNKWATLPKMPVMLGEVASAVIGNNLYVFGGSIDGGPDQKKTLQYNFVTKKWISNLAQRQFPGTHQAAVVYNSKIYVFGGLQSTPKANGKLQIYDPKANKWTNGPDMPWKGGSVNAALIRGKIYIAGGVIDRAHGTVTNTVEFDPVKSSYKSLAPMPFGRNHAAFGTDGAFLYVFGGRDGCNCVANGFNHIQRYDPARNVWTVLGQKLPQARGGMGVAAFTNGKFYIMGGETKSGAGATSKSVYNRVDIFDVKTGKFTLGSPIPTARHGIYPVVFGSAIYVAGGGVKAGNSASDVFEAYYI